MSEMWITVLIVAVFIQGFMLGYEVQTYRFIRFMKELIVEIENKENK